jgi:hypothetical protein
VRGGATRCRNGPVRTYVRTCQQQQQHLLGCRRCMPTLLPAYRYLHMPSPACPAHKWGTCTCCARACVRVCVHACSLTASTPAASCRRCQRRRAPPPPEQRQQQQQQQPCSRQRARAAAAPPGARPRPAGPAGGGGSRPGGCTRRPRRCAGGATHTGAAPEGPGRAGRAARRVSAAVRHRSRIVHAASHQMSLQGGTQPRRHTRRRRWPCPAGRLRWCATDWACMPHAPPGRRWLGAAQAGRRACAWHAA